MASPLTRRCEGRARRRHPQPRQAARDRGAAGAVRVEPVSAGELASPSPTRPAPPSPRMPPSRPRPRPKPPACRRWPMIRACGMWALHGAPGVFSARWAGAGSGAFSRKVGAGTGRKMRRSRTWSIRSGRPDRRRLRQGLHAGDRRGSAELAARGATAPAQRIAPASSRPCAWPGPTATSRRSRAPSMAPSCGRRAAISASVMIRSFFPKARRGHSAK